MEYISQCPVCSHHENDIFLQTQDHFLTKENFSIVQCKQCNFLFTNPRPEISALPSYYESEDYISHSNEKKGLLSLIYKQAQKYSLARKFELLEKLPSKSKLLDYGCGTGAFLNYCKQKGLDTLGIEPNPGAREIAIRNQLKVEDESFVHKLEPGSFDVITMWHVLEHVPLLKERFNTLTEALKPGGRLIVALPNADSWDAKYYHEYWAAYDLPRHLYHFTPDTFRKLAGQFPLTFLSQHPMKLDAYYISLLSEKYKKGKSGYLTAFLKGRTSNCHAKKAKGDYSSLIYVLSKK
jgi:2-polyprenyl-3-methyl-5-hydroxy-6-metoxy-1,4-benzoquinol methylase